MTKAEVDGMAKPRPGWRPDKLRELREAHGLTLEKAGERLRDVVRDAGLEYVAAHAQTLWGHEQGEIYPGADYRRAYCAVYRATEPQLGFRNPWPDEQDSTFAVTPTTERHNGHHVLAVERALHRIAPGGVDSDNMMLQQRIMDAFRRRHTGGDPHRPTMVLVSGFAGSGKSELAKFLTQLTGWPLLDKDPLTRPLVEQLLIAKGCDPNDRHSETYRTEVRGLEYECLMRTAYDNVAAGISTVLAAPFIAEIADADWMARLANRCRSHGADLWPIWVRCDAESMHEYIAMRSAARDAWKLANWSDYIATVDVDTRPVVPHFVVDNRAGAAISLADQARLALAEVRA
ncbi:AAA family ATPase [Kitasatospora sp. NPDC089509]|uniref:AAA family ATPase n=1 Tax=Kitasatospora sp. NPDC089509 TaxID=3364079 RepID=UPI00381B7676